MVIAAHLWSGNQLVARQVHTTFGRRRTRPSTEDLQRTVTHERTTQDVPDDVHDVLRTGS
jgi:hypothetical protein